MSSEPIQVWGLVAAYRRPDRLRGLLASLTGEGQLLAGVVVVDNGGDEATARVLAESPVRVKALQPGRNLGCGGGVAHGLDWALRETSATHFWQLDDDVAVRTGILRELLAALSVRRADAAVPLIVDAANRVSWFPGPLPARDWRALGQEVITPRDFRRRFGAEPLPWEWSPWTSLLMTRRSVEQAGLPRTDYWFQGEDIEFTLRLSSCVGCVLVPTAECIHFAHAPTGPDAFLKKCAQLQNNAYTFTRLPHGRRARRYLPGNIARFLREEGARPQAWWALQQALWRGWWKGQPAGRPGADGFRRAWERRHLPARMSQAQP